MSALVTAAGLKSLLGTPELRIIDASYGLPEADLRIPGAVDFDIDAVADSHAVLPHTLPPPEVFAIHAGALGISNDSRVIVYDRAGMAMAASRVWWMFRVFGHDNVQVLDGGLPAWLQAGYPVEAKTHTKPPALAEFKAVFRPVLFKTRAEMAANLKSGDFSVLDARDARRYSGEMPEPRPGMESGHIPGSLSVPYATLIDHSTGLMKKGADLDAALAAVDRTKPVAISCGSGVTACVVALGLYESEKTDAAVYGGSWAEWGSDLSLPKTKGSQP